MAKTANLDLVASCFERCRIKIENMARRKGHTDPSAFVSDLAYEICENTHPTYHATTRYIWWLAKKRLLDYFRKCARHHKLYPHEVPIDLKLLGTEKESHHQSPRKPPQLIDDAFNSLSPKQRDILDRKYLLGESKEDISRKLGISKSGMRSAEYRAKQRLRQLLPWYS
ncbi:MAG: sigma-70 family RNA polymerase sigma factor [Pirellulales bacterium]|nr:sigma-70 family RNA polymerase sigma factor [Pirellulales bacterium]